MQTNASSERLNTREGFKQGARVTHRGEALGRWLIAGIKGPPLESIPP